MWVYVGRDKRRLYQAPPVGSKTVFPSVLQLLFEPEVNG